jgi:hypothetical protein
MNPQWDKQEWKDSFRLLIKFCPRMKSFFNRPNELTMDSVYEVIVNLEPEVTRERIDDNTLTDIIEQIIKNESERALVIPDLGNSYELPFSCKASRLTQRINEGKGKLKTSYIGDDLLIIFESTGRLLLCDHEYGYILTNELT